MKRIARERPKIDRVACPWPIARFAGLLAISRGLSLNCPDDHEMLEHGTVIYDALYAWCASTVSGRPIRGAMPT
jgi:hypothetical protein